MATIKTKAFSRAILQRFMSEKDFVSFVQQYNENAYHIKSIRKPTDKDLRILNAVKKEQSYSKVAKMLNLTNWEVMSAVGRASTFKE